VGNQGTFYRDATGRHLNGSVSPAIYEMARGMRAMIVDSMIGDSMIVDWRTPIH
jgi:hypothetical protein